MQIKHKSFASLNVYKRLGLTCTELQLDVIGSNGNSEVIRSISDFQLPCISETAGLRAKHKPKSLCYPVLCGNCLPSCQAERQSPWASCIIQSVSLLRS